MFPRKALKNALVAMLRLLGFHTMVRSGVRRVLRAFA